MSGGGTPRTDGAVPGGTARLSLLIHSSLACLLFCAFLQKKGTLYSTFYLIPRRPPRPPLPAGLPQGRLARACFRFFGGCPSPAPAKMEPRRTFARPPCEYRPRPACVARKRTSAAACASLELFGRSLTSSPRPRTSLRTVMVSIQLIRNFNPRQMPSGRPESS